MGATPFRPFIAQPNIITNPLAGVLAAFETGRRQAAERQALATQQQEMELRKAEAARLAESHAINVEAGKLNLSAAKLKQRLAAHTAATQAAEESGMDLLLSPGAGGVGPTGQATEPGAAPVPGLPELPGPPSPGTMTEAPKPFTVPSVEEGAPPEMLDPRLAALRSMARAAHEREIQLQQKSAEARATKLAAGGVPLVQDMVDSLTGITYPKGTILTPEELRDLRPKFHVFPPGPWGETSTLVREPAGLVPAGGARTPKGGAGGGGVPAGAPPRAGGTAAVPPAPTAGAGGAGLPPPGSLPDRIMSLAIKTAPISGTPYVLVPDTADPKMRAAYVRYAGLKGMPVFRQGAKEDVAMTDIQSAHSDLMSAWNKLKGQLPASLPGTWKNKALAELQYGDGGAALKAYNDTVIDFGLRLMKATSGGVGQARGQQVLEKVTKSTPNATTDTFATALSKTERLTTYLGNVEDAILKKSPAAQKAAAVPTGKGTWDTGGGKYTVEQVEAPE